MFVSVSPKMIMRLALLRGKYLQIVLAQAMPYAPYERSAIHRRRGDREGFHKLPIWLGGAEFIGEQFGKFPRLPKVPQNAAEIGKPSRLCNVEIHPSVSCHAVSYAF